MLSDFEKFIIRCSSRYSRSYWLLPSVQWEWTSLDNEMRQHLYFQISVEPAFLWLVDWEKHQSHEAPYFNHTQETFVLLIMVFITANRAMWFWKKAFFRSHSWCFNTFLRILLIFCQMPTKLWIWNMVHSYWTVPVLPIIQRLNWQNFHQYWPPYEIVRRHPSPTEDPSQNTSEKVTFERFLIFTHHYMKSTHLIGKYGS